MRKQLLPSACALAVVLGSVAACGSSGPGPANPELASRGQTLTTAKPTRQDLANHVSLTGKVTMNPVFGLVSPLDGQMRYLDVKTPETTPAKPTKVGNVWAAGSPTSVEVPAGAVFTGRLVDDKSSVTTGMPVASAKHIGYGVVADVDGAQAYRIANSIASVQAQIKDGPGPFPCTVLGTIAALPAGTIPEAPPAQAPAPPPQKPSGGPPAPPSPGGGTKSSGSSGSSGSDATGLRLVCTAPDDVKMINGASATLEVVTEKATNVIVVPVEAVAGSQGKGKVDVVGPDGKRTTKDVVLGLSDGKVVEVKSGLTGDETVAVPGPNLPADQQGGTPGGPTGTR